MPKCDFNKVALQLYWNRTSAWVFSCKFAAYFQNTFSQNTSGWLLLNLTLEGKIVIHKTIAVSKIVFKSFITTVPKHKNELEKNAEGFSVEKLYCQDKAWNSFYRKIILYWKKHLALWLKYLLAFCLNICGAMQVFQVDKTSIQFSRFSKKNYSVCFTTF